ncbi:MAG: fasciclin domain-containing protein [Pyrinomonadaceae bacterium]
MKQTVILTLTLAAATGIAGCGSPAMNTANNTNTSRMSNTVMSTNTNINAMAANNNANMASGNPMVGGAPMLATKDIIDNAVNSKDHTTLVAAVKAAGLVETLKGAGPFTVFAPVNAAFDKLPAGTVDTLLKPGSKKALTGILTYHVVAGKQDAAAIAKAIETGSGKATFKTVAGGTLTASMEGTNVILTDEKGGKSKVTIADVMQSNGVIHVVDSVLMPK